MFTTIDQALDYIYSFVNLEKSFNREKNKNEYSLDNIRSVLGYFGNPQNGRKIIHIAGTKGKGSTTNFISYLFKISGFKVTSFLSPHLIVPNERIMCDMENISDDELIGITNYVEPVLTSNNLKPTTFEIFFIIFLIFSRNKNADFLVIETGLGGRLDCTNIVSPVISVITPISYDHMNILGKTIKSISLEKAGIIKENAPVVVSRQTYNCLHIFRKIAGSKNADLYDIMKFFKLIRVTPDKHGITSDFEFDGVTYKNFFLPVLGCHQIYNFATALLSVFLINKDILEAIRTKTIDIRIPGRIELIRSEPPVILDVSHNADSAKKLVSTLHLHFPGIKWTVLAGMTEDKDYEGFFRNIRKISSELIITSPSKFKKSEPDKVYKTAKKMFRNSIFMESIEDATAYVSGRKTPLLVTGSFYIAGPFMELYR
jgi:dihydrofolate synthase / folylpolyglutamate synthase